LATPFIEDREELLVQTEPRIAEKSLIIGHRGASRDAPENTLASFRLAFEQGADGVEADFRLTRDGAIVCVHDASTGRTAGADLCVANSDLAALRRLDLGLWKGELWRGEHLPTLEQLLLLLPPGKRIFIEIKCGGEIIAPLAATLAGSTLSPDQVRLLTFSADLARGLKEGLPQYRVCWLTDYRFRGVWRPSRSEVLKTLKECRADGLASRDRALLDSSLVEALRQEDLEIHVWTVDSANAGRRLLALGVDSIITNRPGFMRRALYGRVSRSGAGEDPER
jgi:glycerophosphoryl diester phosphodiesterase